MRSSVSADVFGCMFDNLELITHVLNCRNATGELNEELVRTRVASKQRRIERKQITFELLRGGSKELEFCTQ